MDVSAELLRTITYVPDLRAALPRLSEIANRMLPHDALALDLVDPDGHLVTEATVGDLPEIAPRGVKMPLRDGLIIGDLTSESLPAPGGSNPTSWLVGRGYRSLLTTFTRVGDQMLGVAFWSKHRNAYEPRHLPLARGVVDHLAVAVSRERLASAIRVPGNGSARARELDRHPRMASESLSARTHTGVVGESAEWREVLKKATQVAETDTTVLVTGESGTGKEVVARFIHRASARNRGPFVALNCAALPEQLLESELFGYERGAFTSAQQAKPGQIELASGGVLFLDEVTEMSLAAQAKFLRVLQEREFQRLGGTRTLKANIRVIAATNRDLRKAVERGAFREDLFYRLKVFDIGIPPLRERAADILPLSEALLQDIGRSFERPPADLTPDAREALLGYHWPATSASSATRSSAPPFFAKEGSFARNTSHWKRQASRRARFRPISARSSATPSRRSWASAAGTGRGPPSASASRARSSISDCRSMGWSSPRHNLAKTSRWRRTRAERYQSQEDALRSKPQFTCVACGAGLQACLRAPICRAEALPHMSDAVTTQVSAGSRRRWRPDPLRLAPSDRSAR